MSKLTYLDEAGRARMVDVGDKAVTSRRTEARGELVCAPATLALVRAGKTPKVSAVATVELAGVMAAKRTANPIPLYYTLALSKVAGEIAMDEALPGARS